MNPKNKKLFSFYIQIDLYKRAKKYAQEEMRSIAWILNKALQEYLSKKKF